MEKHNAHVQVRAVHGSNIVPTPMTRKPKQDNAGMVLVGTIIMSVLAFSILILGYMYWDVLVAVFKAVVLAVGAIFLAWFTLRV